jgi:hypothetical protein
VSAPDFVFETEFTLLDVGATGALIRSGGIRPTVIAYTRGSEAESVVLDWRTPEECTEAYEEARRWLRALDPVAYATAALIERQEDVVRHYGPQDRPEDGCLLALALLSADGMVRGMLYPVQRGADGITLGRPTTTESEDTDWCPIGDIWANPFCVGDVVRLKPRERAMDPSSALWKSIIDLTKMRIQNDETRSPDYMAFLDDLRNGVFSVAGRPANNSLKVLLKPRTIYNPLGFLTLDASRLTLIEPKPAPRDEVVRP